MIFSKKDTPELKFTSRADAFAYMLREQLDRRVEPMEAAERANSFADIFASNMGLPTTPERQAEGVERYLQHVDKIMCYCEQHPKAVDMVVGVATFVLGALAGKTAEENQTQVAAPQEPIDFDKLE